MARGRVDGRRVVDLSPAIDSPITTDRIGRRAVFVSNLPLNASEDDVRAYFECAGTIESLKIWEDHRGGQQLGTVTYQYPTDAKKALASLHRTEFKRRVLGLAFAR